MRSLAFGAALLFAVPAAGAYEMSYQGYSQMGAGHPLRCLMAYPAHKTGDHAASVEILRTCVAEGNVWAMIGLAMMYENGAGVPRSLEASADLMRRAAAMDDPAGYASLARYHWGMALLEGRGVERDEAQARHWLRIAAQEGVREAAEALEALPASTDGAGDPRRTGHAGAAR